MFEVGKRYTVVMPVGTITESGIREIALFIEKQRIDSDDWQARNPDDKRKYLNPLPDDWNYQWVITGRGEYVGTFPKRVSKYYWQTYQLRCPNSFVAELGQIARRNSSDDSQYRIDFTDKLNWQAGDYGDSGSCLWGSNESGRDAMQENGVQAVRFYHGNGDGYGRAWLYKWRGLWLLWNGYGVKGGTIGIARVLGQFWGMSYKKIYLSNQGNSGGQVYINGGRGFVIGQADKLTNLSRIDLGFETLGTCDSCGYDIHEGENYVTPDGEDYCQDCFYEHYDYCVFCGETHYRETMYMTMPHYEDVCENCLDRHYERCEGCEEYYRDSAIHVHKKGRYCEGCLPK